MMVELHKLERENKKFREITLNFENLLSNNNSIELLITSETYA